METPRFFVLLPFLASFATCAAPAEQPKAVAPPVVAHAPSPAESVIALGRRDNRVMETERTLTRDHPKRLTGSKGYDGAAQWAVETFRSYGLDARLEKWGEMPIAFDRGAQEGRVVFDDGTQAPLVFATMSWTAGTNGSARGPAVLEPRTQAELDAIDPHHVFAGAWIVHTETKEGAKFRKRLREEYEAAGILGTLRRGSPDGRLGMGGNSGVDPAKLPAQVDAKILASQYDEIVARLGKKERVDITIDSENIFGASPAVCSNVIADLRGTEHPEEFVIVQGHLDAWDGAQGAQDNGTGTSTTIEAARLITAAGVKPKRTIRFVLYSGEEQGLFGSEGYVRDHAKELPDISVVLTHDAGGSYLDGIDATYAQLDDTLKVCAPLTLLDPRFPFTVHEVDGLQNSGDSDHAPFIEKGVPSFFWHQNEKGYEHVHHTQYDTIDEVDPAQLEHSALVVAVAAIGYANLDHKLDRTDMKPLTRRRMGVRLGDSAVVEQVTEDGRAGKAGWKVGDKIVAVDGVAVSTQAEAIEKLQEGGSKKRFRLKRGDETIESVLDYTGDPGEAERAERAARREAFHRTKPATHPK
jgi:carboxypeptidase Q